jgi:hypothetical protein
MLASTMQFSNNQHSKEQTYPFPENPTARPTPVPCNHPPRRSSTSDHTKPCRIVNVPPMSNQHRTFADELASDQANPVRSAP